MNFEEAVDWLYSFQKFGIKLGLERINYLAEKLRNPYLEYDVIHVGGTNGKGSVCRVLASILKEAGYSTGVYTSPHLSDIRERIVVSGEVISDEDFSKLVEQILPIVEEMKQNNETPTFFEILTIMAFEYFKKKEIDVAVVEVGLGGRHDATNVVNPSLTALTDVSLDHLDVLGNNMRSIALEKAGIVKQGVSVVTSAKGEALDVVKRVAKEKNIDVIGVDKSTWERIKLTDNGQELLVHGVLKDYNVKTSLLGRYQGENIALAILAIEVLQMQGLYLPGDSIERGVSGAVNPGRMEVVLRKPYVVLDGAHNPAGMHALVETITNDFSYSELIGVLGILKDKDVRSMVKVFAPVASYIVVTKPKSKRACNTKIVADFIKESNPSCVVEIKESVRDAVFRAEEIATPDDLVCVTGSLYTVGGVRDIFLHKLI